MKCRIIRMIGTESELAEIWVVAEFEDEVSTGSGSDRVVVSQT
jgi:hypothetical protein